MIVELRCPSCDRLLRRYQRTEESASEDAWSSALIGDCVGDIAHCPCGRSERLSKADAVVGSQRGRLTALRGLRKRAHARREVPPPLPAAPPQPKAKPVSVHLMNGTHVLIDGVMFEGDTVTQLADGRLVVGRRAPSDLPGKQKDSER